MNPRTRFAQPHDLAGVLALYRVLRPHDPVLPQAAADAKWAELLARDDIRLVVAQAEQGSVFAQVGNQDALANAPQLGATCMIALVPNLATAGQPFAVIEHVVTLPECRGQGLGRAVMQHALDFAWARGCYKVMLLSGAQRVDAHRLYEGLGFRGDVERGFVAKRPV
jgi:GNAT superfamily N-acetyltransferase